MKGLLFLFLLGGPVRAVLAAPQSAPATQPSTRLLLNARATDYSGMMRARHAGGGHGAAANAPALPLANLPVSIEIQPPGGAPPRPPLELRTDDQGQLRGDLGEAAPGTILRLNAKRPGLTPASGAGAERFIARPIEWAGTGLPADVAFYRVGDEASGVLIFELMQIVTVKEGDPGSDPSTWRLQLRQITRVVNSGIDSQFEAWLGDAAATEPVSAWIPVPLPKGWEVLDVQVDGRSVTPALADLPHGGKGFPLRQPLFPEIDARGVTQVVTLATGPYQEDVDIDVGMHTDLSILSYRLNLDQGGEGRKGLQYVPPPEGSDMVALADQGAMEGMGAAKKVTRTFAAAKIEPHSTVRATFRAGRPPIATKTILVTLSIVSVVVLAITFGRVMARRGAVAPAGAGDDAAAQLADVDRRFAAGEMTSVEHAARRAVLLGGGAAPSRPAAATGTQVAEPVARDAVLRRLEEIAGRAAPGPNASGEDVRVLAQALLQILRR